MGATFEFAVLDEPPPLKGEAKSMLSEGHKQAGRVRALLHASYEAKQRAGFIGFGTQRIGMELVVASRLHSGDATNALGGVGDTLQSRRSNIDVTHLGRLADAFLYEDDAHLREVTYREDARWPATRSGSGSCISTVSGCRSRLAQASYPRH